MEDESQGKHCSNSTENGTHTNDSMDLGCCTLVKVGEHAIRAVPGHQPCFTGVAIHSDGRILLSDLVGYLCLFNPADKSTVYIKLTYAAYSAVEIDKCTLAVSTPDDMSIIKVLIDGHSLHVQKTFPTPTQPRSIVSLGNGQLAVGWRNPPAFGIVDISGDTLIQKSYFQQDSTGRNFKSLEYLAVDKNRRHVIQPCTEDEAVYCFDFEANPVFVYKDAKLASPRGVAVDVCGNVFVCDCSSVGSIHQLSPTGQLIGVFTMGVPSFPTAICADAAGVDLYVAQGSMPLFLIVQFLLGNSTNL